MTGSNDGNLLKDAKVPGDCIPFSPERSFDFRLIDVMLFNWVGPLSVNVWQANDAKFEYFQQKSYLVSFFSFLRIQEDTLRITTKFSNMFYRRDARV